MKNQLGPLIDCIVKKNHKSLEQVVQELVGEAYFSQINEGKVQAIAKKLGRRPIDDKHFICTLNRGEYTETGFLVRTKYMVPLGRRTRRLILRPVNRQGKLPPQLL